MRYFIMTIPVTATMTAADLREIIGLVANDVDVSNTGVHEYQQLHADDMIVT